jgi:arylsulfatase A-like enzyme
VRRSLSFWIGALVVLAAIGGVVGSMRRGGGGASRPRARGVVIVSIDTLRADTTEPDASGATLLPSLETFAKDAQRFTGAVAGSSWTAPSLATLLTGFVPLRHGLVEATDDAHLPASVPTVAAILRNAGWSTWASTGGGWASKAAGFDAGFERFAEDFDDEPPATAIAKWREQRPIDRPFFLWLHTYVAHDPYGGKDAETGRDCDAETNVGRSLASRMGDSTPAVAAQSRRDFVIWRLSSPCRKRGLDSALRNAGTFTFWRKFVPWLNGGWQADPDDVAAVARLRESYRENVRTIVERRIRGTLDALASVLPSDDVVVIVVADHGEAFGEHEVLHHGSRVTEELVRVPMMIRGPGFPAGTTVNASCGLVDVTPTILDLAGLPTPPSLDGHSLLSLAAGPAGGHPVESVVLPVNWFEAPDEPRNCRVSVRDRGTAWLATFHLSTASWAEETWFNRLKDPHEHAPLAAPSPAAIDPAVRDAVAAAKGRVERRYGRPAAPPPKRDK